ncbi:LuxR family transcriptional regulator [Rhodococcus sp. 06-235-1A]|nr:LuxR family transcriptional regulator [Rhodococcus sp. 06-235-1A]
MVAERPRPTPSVTTFADPGLTAREIAVLGAWLRCDSKQEVCAVLHIALGTVNTHLSRIRVKYAGVGRAAPTKASLVARALQDGLVALDDL